MRQFPCSVPFSNSNTEKLNQENYLIALVQRTDYILGWGECGKSNETSGLRTSLQSVRALPHESIWWLHCEHVVKTSSKKSSSYPLSIQLYHNLY